MAPSGIQQRLTSDPPHINRETAKETETEKTVKRVREVRERQAEIEEGRKRHRERESCLPLVKNPVWEGQGRFTISLYLHGRNNINYRNK